MHKQMAHTHVVYTCVCVLVRRSATHLLSQGREASYKRCSEQSRTTRDLRASSHLCMQVHRVFYI